MMKLLRPILSAALIDLMALSPLAVLLPSAAQAATSNTSKPDCAAPAPNQGVAPSLYTDAGADDPEANAGGDAPQYPFLSEVDQDNDPLSLKNTDPDQFQSQLNTYLQNNNGWYDSEAQAWYFCSQVNLDNFGGPLSFGSKQNQYLSTLAFPTSKITFQNPLDYYALVGEPCTQFQANSTVCDEAKDDTGHPKYYDDTYWPNGRWDAPKADARILQTLVYLVTPKPLGAGREHIKVSKIIQPTEKNREFASVKDASQPEIQLDDDAGQTEEETTANSSHSYDLLNPSNPSTVAKAVDISEIDNVRITTKIVQRRRIGGDSVDYKYSSFPIKVSYQTDQGVQSAPLVPGDIYRSALSGFTLGLGQLLDQFDLSADIDASSIDINSIGDVAELIGQSLLTQLLSSPTGSLQGWDFKSLVEKLGRIYLASQLGLSPNALLKGNTVDDLVINVGRAKVEKAFGFPLDSLLGKTSNEVLINVGIRSMEDAFGVTAGTLTAKQYSQTELLERIGAGRIEKRFGLQPGTVSNANDWSSLQSIPKIKYTFTAADATFVDDALGLGYEENSDGISEGELTDTTAKFLAGGLSFARYKYIVGSRALLSGIGRFKSTGTDSPVQTDPQTHDFINGGAEQLGLKLVTGELTPPTSDETWKVIWSEYSGAYKYHGVLANVNARDYQSFMKLSDDDLISIGKRLLTASETKQFTDVCNPLIRNACYMEGSILTKNHNEIASFWKPYFQRALTKANAELATPPDNQDVSNRSIIQSIQTRMSTTLGLVKAHDDAIVTFLETQGQSGRSAGLGLPGTLLKQSPDGSYPGGALINADPVNAMLAGNFTPELMRTIGQIETAKRLSSDLSAQRSIISMLNLDPGSISDQVNGFGKLFANYGIDVSRWLAQGLEKNDLDRIFFRGLGDESFRRVGQLEILRTVWHKSGLQQKVDETVKNGQGDLSDLYNQINQVSQNLDFYLSRLTKLKNYGKSIRGKLNGVDDLPPDLTQTLEGLNNGTDPGSIADARTYSEKYEPLFAALQGRDNLKSVLDDIVGARQLIREIVAGHYLSFDQSVDTGSLTTAKENRCFQFGDLRNFFKDNTSALTSLAAQVGACRLDSSLNLPAGSLFTWYSSGDFTFDGLSIAIGKTDAAASRENLSNDDAKARGKKILETMGMQALMGLVPGFNKLGLSAQSIFELLNGNTSSVLRTLGTNMMDTFLNWKPGTAAAIINPTCLDADGKAQTCTREGADKQRLTFLAQQGLRDLGLALNFPSSFTLFPDANSPLRGMDIVNGFAVSQISQVLGLAPNSFYGSFKDVRSRNKAQYTTVALSWYLTSPLQRLATLREDLRAANLGSAATSIDDFLNNRADAMLNELSNPGSGFWGNTLAQAVTGATLFASDRDAYTAFLPTLRSLLESAHASGDLLSRVDALKQINWDKDANASLAATYVNQVGSVQSRVNGLDSQYRLAAGTFRSFIVGEKDAAAITDIAGKTVLTGLLADSTLDRLLRGTPFEQLTSTFGALTDGCKLTDLFLGEGSACSGGGLKNISLSEILNGTSQSAQLKRLFLYDHFLSRAWGEKLEQSLNLEPGTLRVIALQPWRAKEIALDQGIRMVASNIFGRDMNDSKWAPYAFALRDTLMAGFCGIDPLIDGEQAKNTRQPCTLSFNNQRAMFQLHQSIDRIIEDAFGRRNDTYSISLADLSYVFSGGLQGVYFFGAQRLANQLNSSLDANDARSGAFKIKFSDIRNAFSSLTFTNDDWKEFSTKYQANFIRSELSLLNEQNGSDCDADTGPIKNWCSLSDDDLITAYLTGNAELDTAFGDQETRQHSLDQVGEDARSTGAGRMQKVLLDRLQYQVFDILAFNLDHNVPAGFSHAIFAGTSAERARMLSLFFLNTINFDKLLFGDFPGLSGDLVLNLANAIKAGDWNAINLDTVNALDSWFNQNGSKLLGINLPSGTIPGLIVWAKNGFSGATFDTSEKYSLGGKEFSSLGTVLRGWGINQLFSWTDKALGFQAGGAFQIYDAAAKVAAAQRNVSLAQNLLQQGKTVDLLGAKVSTQQLANQARVQLRAAQAALISTVVNLVFSSQIAGVEQSLGLVPGTGALAVTMLVQLAMGVPVDPITLGIFIAINLFGVYKVDIYQKATVDGYYPFTGTYGTARPDPLEYVSTDQEQGVFDALAPEDYRLGLRNGARAKVQGLLQDILLMPERWSNATGILPNNLWVSQTYTGRSEDISDLDYLISQPAPWNSPAGIGYGPLTDRTSLEFDAETGTYQAVPVPGYRAGVFASNIFNDHLHLRW